MTDTDALLAAVIADPADDTLRLIYADTLTTLAESLDGSDREFVEARAEFIRVQIALASDPIEEALNNHVRGLFRIVSKQPIFNVPKQGKWSIPRYIYAPDLSQWERGFVATLATAWSYWRDHHKAIRERQPIKRVVFPEANIWNHGGIEIRLVRQQPDVVEYIIDGESVTVSESDVFPGITINEQHKIALERRWPGIEFVLPSDEETLAGRIPQYQETAPRG